MSFRANFLVTHLFNEDYSVLILPSYYDPGVDSACDMISRNLPRGKCKDDSLASYVLIGC
jgi:hypothetical protein